VRTRTARINGQRRHGDIGTDVTSGDRQVDSARAMMRLTMSKSRRRRSSVSTTTH
jgi:predicted acetyltransferase